MRTGTGTTKPFRNSVEHKVINVPIWPDAGLIMTYGMVSERHGDLTWLVQRWPQICNDYFRVAWEEILFVADRLARVSHRARDHDAARRARQLLEQPGGHDS